MNVITVQEFLSEYNDSHNTTIDDNQKMRWLQRIEMKVMQEVMYSTDEKDKPGLLPGDIIKYEKPDLKARISDNVLDISDEPGMYIDGDSLVLTGYDPVYGRREADEFGPTTRLQIPKPYDDVYEYWLDARIAYAEHNMKLYDRCAAMFNNAYLEFQKYWFRTHRTNRVKNHFIRHEVL